MLIQLDGDFWNHVQQNIPPPLDGSEAAYKFVFSRFPDSVPMSKIDLPDTANLMVKTYYTACDHLDTLTDQKREAETLLQEILGVNELVTIGDKVITWKTIFQERLDSKTLKAEHTTLYKKYAAKSTYSRFSIKPAN